VALNADDKLAIRWTCLRCGFESPWLHEAEMLGLRDEHIAQHESDDLDAAARQGAPRQALDGTRDAGLRQTDLGDHDTLRALGIAVEVGTLVPSGSAVRLSVDDIARWLDPEEAHRLSIALRLAAEEAIHEDRAARRG
jgi:hypothetical protein